MAGTKGAEAVLMAWRSGRTLKMGNARTDGRSYFLFDKEIARIGPPTDALIAKAKILGQSVRTNELWFTFAGWLAYAVHDAPPQCVQYVDQREHLSQTRRAPVHQ